MQLPALVSYHNKSLLGIEEKHIPMVTLSLFSSARFTTSHPTQNELLLLLNHHLTSWSLHFLLSDPSTHNLLFAPPQSPSAILPVPILGSYPSQRPHCKICPIKLAPLATSSTSSPVKYFVCSSENAKNCNIVK